MKKLIAVVVAVVVASLSVISVDNAPASASTRDCGSGYTYLQSGYGTGTQVSLYVNLRTYDWCAITYRRGSYTKYAESTYVWLCKGSASYGTNCAEWQGKVRTQTRAVHKKADCVTAYGAAFARHAGSADIIHLPHKTWCGRDLA